jgi:hypothetical protein
MARGKKKDGKLTLTGALNTKGRVSGKGALTLTVSDLTRAGLSLDYRKTGALILKLESSTGLRIRKSRTLKFTGSLARDLTSGSLEGKVGVDLKVPRGLDVSVSHRFKPDENRTAVKVTVRF